MILWSQELGSNRSEFFSLFLFHKDILYNQPTPAPLLKKNEIRKSIGGFEVNYYSKIAGNVTFPAIIVFGPKVVWASKSRKQAINVDLAQMYPLKPDNQPLKEVGQTLRSIPC